MVPASHHEEVCTTAHLGRGTSSKPFAFLSLHFILVVWMTAKSKKSYVSESFWTESLWGQRQTDSFALYQNLSRNQKISTHSMSALGSILQRESAQGKAVHSTNLNCLLPLLGKASGALIRDPRVLGASYQSGTRQRRGGIIGAAAPRILAHPIPLTSRKRTL